MSVASWSVITSHTPSQARIKMGQFPQSVSLRGEREERKEREEELGMRVGV
jgi:hypothetical protein